MKAIKVTLAVLVALPGGVALAEDKADVHSSVTNPDGTTVTVDKSHTTSEGWLGGKKYEADEKTVVDPKGLVNKQVASRHYERKAGSDGDVKEKAEYQHPDGTSEELSASKTTSEHLLDSGKTVTKTHARVVDPKGLGNKQEVEVTEKTEINPDGSKRTTVSREVNGDTVSETKTETH
ncbi:MAG: hypothetical protein K1X83_13160 [Oligoflexia bacterium]|nr:hypothetical protein [Oligoflexia bacterium]